ncbi:MAG: ABC transporter ATP-binding protein [Phycisphaerae bacterium]|nr:ABC transporter ATP-binding protein [Phycisphaerae bacterium]
MIEITDLTHRYGSLVALDRLTLHIGPGEVFGFIGPNGAGKSTAMKILACLLRPTAGDARVCGHRVHDSGDAIRGLVGYMPDFLGVYEDLTVDEYLQFFAAAFRIPARNGKRAAVVDSVLQLTDLTAKRHAMVDSLSRGMQQRLGVARVLLHEPQVLLLDEPASGLDPRARIELRSLLTELRNMGKCIMVSSHILTELAEMSTSIGIIERGTLLFAGPIGEAFARAGAGERIAVTLEGGPADARAIAADLASDPRVRSVAAEDRSLTIELAPAVNGHHFLIEAVIARGGRIASFTPRPLKLEEAFLRLTRGAVN